MAYPYEQAKGGLDDTQEAEIPADVDGACPPEVSQYRIYPEADFGDLFSDPPRTIKL